MKIVKVDSSFKNWAEKGKEVVLLVRRGNKYAFIDNKHSNEAYPEVKIVRPPTGGIDGEEGPLKAALRELKEELGIDTQYLEFIRPMTYRVEFSDGEHLMFMSYVYRLTIPEDQQVEFKDKAEYVEKIYWLPIEKFPAAAEQFNAGKHELAPKTFFPAGDLYWDDWCRFRQTQLKEIYETVRL